MGTARNFHVKTGLNIDAGDVTVTSGNLLLNAGYIDVDSLKLDGQTISTVTGDENINVTPHGTGSVVISKVDINGGVVDNAAIGASTASTAAFTTLTASGATTLDGAVTLGNATADDITNTGRWVGDFVPKVDSSIDLGTTALQFAEAHIDTGHIDALTVTGTSTLSTVDIGAGAIDGTTIGAASAAAITGTTITGTTITASDQLVVNAGASIIGDTTNEITLNVKGVGSQSVDHFNVELSDGTDKFTVSSAGVTTAASLVATTADINAGTVDATTVGVTTAAAGNFSTIGATTTGTIAGTTIDASTDFTIGSTVITDDSIVMTPSTDDTVTMAASASGAFALTTVDTAGTDASIVLSADGQMRLLVATGSQIILGTGAGNQVTVLDGQLSPVSDNDIDLGADNKEYKDVWVEGLVTSGSGVHLGYGANSKLNVISGGVEVTGTLDASSTVYGGGFKSSLEQIAPNTGVDLVSNATFRTAEDSGVFKDSDIDTNFTTTHIENTNFTGSVMITDADGVALAVPSTHVVPLAYINLDDTTNNIYHSAEFHCAMQEKVTSGNVAKQWLSQKLKASYDGSTVKFQTSDTRWTNVDLTGSPPPGEFCAQKWSDGTNIFMVISYCPYLLTASTRTVTYTINMNGLSTPIQISA